MSVVKPTRRRLPRLKTDTVALFNLYHNNQTVRSTDISRTFSVSKNTGLNVIHSVIDYMQQQGITPYTYELEVPVQMLFDLYGWDIKQINKSYKVMHDFIKEVQ